MGISFRNEEGYADPTAYEALKKLDNKAKRKLVYICSPFSGDIKGNTKRAKKYSRFAVDSGVIPFAPHLLFPLYMREENERELAMQMNMEFLVRLDELWVFGSKVTKGMSMEIRKAKKENMIVRYFTEDLLEV